MFKTTAKRETIYDLINAPPKSAADAYTEAIGQVRGVTLTPDEAMSLAYFFAGYEPELFIQQLRFRRGGVL